MNIAGMVHALYDGQPRWQVLERYTKQKQARAPALVEKLSGMVPDSFRPGAQPAP